MKEYKNKFAMFWKRNSNVISFVAYNKVIANRVNKKLGYYPSDTKFTDLDEPLFKASKEAFNLVIKDLGIKCSLDEFWGMLEY